MKIKPYIAYQIVFYAFVVITIACYINAIVSIVKWLL